jgi:hypothetical protein
MKTLSEIIDETKDGGRPEYDELRYALVAMCAMHRFAFMSLMDLAGREREGKYKPGLFGLDWASRERFNQFKAALEIPPKQYVGESHDPDGEEAKRWLKISKGILRRVSENKQSPN